MTGKYSFLGPYTTYGKYRSVTPTDALIYLRIGMADRRKDNEKNYRRTGSFCGGNRQ